MEKIKAILTTKTIRQGVVTSVSTVINGLLGVIFYILSARILGPNDFGILVVSLTTLTMVADMAAVGTDTGIVKFVGKYFESDKRKALQFLKLGLEIKTLVGFIVVLIGWFLIPFISGVVLAKPELIFPLRLSLVGVFATLIFSFATSSLQAIQKFWTWGAVSVTSNTIRIGVVIFLSSISMLNINSVLVSYIACIFLGFFISLVFLPNFFRAKGERSLAGEFVGYNKWVAMFVVIAAIAARLDTFLSTRLLSLSDVGVYGVATGLASIGSQIVAGITTVVAPKLASMDTDRKALEYLKKLQILTLTLGVAAVVIGIPLSYFVVPLLYGQEYLSSVAPFTVLLVSQAIFLISIPAHSSVIFYFGYPKLFVYVSLVHLMIIGGLGFYLISNLGMIGAAYTVLIGSVSNFLIPLFWALNKFKKGKSN